MKLIGKFKLADPNTVLIVTQVCLYYVMTNKDALHEDLEETYMYFLRVYNIADNKQQKYCIMHCINCTSNSSVL